MADTPATETTTTSYRVIAMLVVRRYLSDLRLPTLREVAEDWFCSAEGRGWIDLAGMNYDAVMRKAEEQLDLPLIDRRRKKREIIPEKSPA